jgi:hypothetical protein
MTRRLRAEGFALAILLLGAGYTALEWTPSSYALVLERLAIEDTGLVAGRPRAIRQDEWLRWTPFIQAAVNNDLGRHNERSLYREDLRGVEGLPLSDWALVFKPYFWPFLLTAPARAFSFFHAAWMALFLIGYERLFRALGSPRSHAALASLTLFFSSFAQTWWTTFGPVIAGFPWVLLLVLARLAPPWKVLGLAYVSAAWLLGNFYPPIQATLGFAAAVVLLALRPEALRPARLVPCVLGVALGGGLVLLYFHDFLFAMADTVYPGRRITGGGGEPPLQWLGHLLPALPMSGYRNLVNGNVCEASTVGTWLPLLLLFFTDWTGLRAKLRARDASGRPGAWPLAVLAAGVLATSLWMFAPLPPALGAPLLWNRVPPIRMWYACGLLLVLLALVALRMAPLRLSAARLAGFAATVLGAWVVSEGLLARAPSPSLADASVLLPLGAVFALRRRLAHALPTALLASAALANALAFGGFNPIQSARPIFERADSPARRALDRLSQRHPRGWLVLAGDHGAWQNGWGYPAATHVLLAPQLDFFRALLPQTPEPMLQWFFNRSTYVKLGLLDEIRLHDDVQISVPITAFDPPTLPVEVVAEASGRHPRAGVVHRRSPFLQDDVVGLQLTGWGRLDGSRPEPRLRVVTGLPVRRAVAHPLLDASAARELGDPELVLSGFALRLDLELEPGLEEQAAPRALLQRIAASPVCVISEDPERGSFLLDEPDFREHCRGLVEPEP